MNSVLLLSSSSSGGDALLWMAVELVVALVGIISMWSLFMKAGRNGWEILIPFYNLYCLADIGCDIPILWTILSFIPVANFVAYCVIMFKLAKAFDQSTVFAIVLILLPIVGIPMLAFGSAQYGGSYY